MASIGGQAFILPSMFNPWDQQPNESAKAFERFALYRDMGVGRSVRKLAKDLGAPQVQCIEAELTPKDNAKNCETIFASVPEIIHLKKINISSNKLPKNLSACFKYGRCPFYARCKGKLEKASTKEIISDEAKEYPVPSPSVPLQSSFHLFIDCVPTKNESPYERTLELSELLKPVLNKIHTEKELSHYRLAGYGQHVGLIANYLSKHLKNNVYDNRTAILSSIKTPEGCDTLQTLIAAAGHVVRGF